MLHLFVQLAVAYMFVGLFLGSWGIGLIGVGMAIAIQLIRQEKEAGRL